MNLTSRQSFEKNHYNEFYRKHLNSFLGEVKTLGEQRKSYNPYWRIYELVAENELRGRRILDCGCGAGEHSIRLASMGAVVHGVDISETAVEIAKERAKESGCGDRLSFSVSTLEQLPFEDDYFDFVFGVDILHHVDVRKAILEVERILKRQGKAFFKEWREFPMFDKIRNSSLGLKLVPKIPKSAHFVDYTPMEKKLSDEELLFVKSHFSRVEFHHFRVVARLARLVKDGIFIEKLLKIDHWLMRYIPFMKILSGEVIIVIEK